MKEYLNFLRANRNWWLACVAIVLLILGVLVLLGRADDAPFIYIQY